MSFLNRRPPVWSLFTSIYGHHVAGWRHPDTPLAKGPSFASYRDLAIEAERNSYDLFFLADILYNTDHSSGRRPSGVGFEPITLLSALSAVTSRIGLAATISTTYTAPFATARSVASLDHLSDGRAAWNVVTSLNDFEARNFGQELHLAHEDRYTRAGEFIALVRKFWDSVDDRSFIGDKVSGNAFDPSLVKRFKHRGDYFNVAGVANIQRPPQGHPVIIQAGSSDRGKELAAETADLVFTAQKDLENAQKYYRSLKGRMAAYGRAPGDLAVLPGMMPIVARTEAEAKAKFEQLQDLIDPVIGLSLLATILGEIDLSGVDVDKPLPDFVASSGSLSRFALVTEIAKEEKLTVRQLYTRIAGARGHFTVVGDPEQVADTLIAWFDGEGADGFNVMSAAGPGFFEDFNSLVMPILRERGYARSGYEGRTLRDNLGLPRPDNVHLAARSAAAAVAS